MADVPWGTVRIRQDPQDVEANYCRVYVGDRPVANLPIAGAVWEVELGRARTSYVKLRLLAEQVEIDTRTPKQRQEDPEDGRE